MHCVSAQSCLFQYPAKALNRVSDFLKKIAARIEKIAVWAFLLLCPCFQTRKKSSPLKPNQIKVIKTPKKIAPLKPESCKKKPRQKRRHKRQASSLQIFMSPEKSSSPSRKISPLENLPSKGFCFSMEITNKETSYAVASYLLYALMEDKEEVRSFADLEKICQNGLESYESKDSFFQDCNLEKIRESFQDAPPLVCLDMEPTFKKVQDHSYHLLWEKRENVLSVLFIRPEKKDCFLFQPYNPYGSSELLYFPNAQAFGKYFQIGSSYSWKTC